MAALAAGALLLALWGAAALAVFGSVAAALPAGAAVLALTALLFTNRLSPAGRLLLLPQRCRTHGLNWWPAEHTARAQHSTAQYAAAHKKLTKMNAGSQPTHVVACLYCSLLAAIQPRTLLLRHGLVALAAPLPGLAAPSDVDPRHGALASCRPCCH